MPISTTNNADDLTLARLLTAVSQDFQRATHRPDLLQASYTKTRDGDGSTRLILYRWPIVSISSLKIGGVTITASADKIAPGYYIDQDMAQLAADAIGLLGCKADEREEMALALVSASAPQHVREITPILLKCRSSRLNPRQAQ